MPEASERPRVLVVDDNRFHRELAKDVLADRAEVETCRDADEALAALGRRRADLVLSDLIMPGLSGLELLQLVQRRYPGTDFVLLTANASIDSAIEALRMGAADYLQKPVRAADLLLVFERTLARRKLLADNLRLRDEIAIYEACRALGACLDPEDVFAVGLELLLRATGAEAGLAIFARHPVPGSQGLHCRGLDEAAEDRLRLALGARKPLELADRPGVEAPATGPLVELLRELGIAEAALIAVPTGLAAPEAGLFCALGSDWSPVAQAHAGVVASHAGVALKNAARYRSARERAFIDDTTEVYNARYLLEALDREIRRAERYGSELSILFLDLDRFKLVNDNHGHLIGSNTLRHVSQLLSQSVRQVDTVARYGGDEFTVLLVDTNERGARIIAERIRHVVETTAFEAGGAPALSLTCSIGVSAYPLHGRTREALLDAADKAMYRAKSNGRNRVCSASELS